MKMFFALLSLCLSTISLAAPFELKGSYFFRKGEKDPVSFRLRWVEEDGRVAGFYSDDRFSKRAPVKGMVSETGRTFQIVLPEEKNGIKAFTVLTSAVDSPTKVKFIPLQLVAPDMRGNPLTTAKFHGQFLVQESDQRKAQAQEEAPCMEGFGEMAGYCGRYGGMISEEFDSGKLCDFMTLKNVRLEVDNEANVIFHTEQPGDRHMSQDHLVGRIPSAAPSRTIDLMSRHCRPLPGTNFEGDDCKRINLIGTFSNRNGEPHFTGTYAIINEKNDRSCRYTMTMDLVERL